MASRKSTFKLYPNATQRVALVRVTAAHCRVYNTLLETSKLRFKAGLPAYTRASVCQDTKTIRNALGDIKANTLAQSLQVTGERLVKAFDRFFDRVSKGETPGYPRFKSSARFPGFGFKQHTQGYKLLRKKTVANGRKDGWAYGAVQLSGIGTISMKGCARFDGQPSSAEVCREGDDWYLSVTFTVDESAVKRECEDLAPFAFDAGLTDLLTTLEYQDGKAVYDTVSNPRWLKSKLSDLVEAQRAVSLLEQSAIQASGKTKGFPVGPQLKAAYARMRSIHKKVRNQREDFYHKLSALMVSRFGHIITEELSPGSILGDQSKGSALKRSVSDAAWGGFLDKLRSKAEEAGAKYEEVPTRLVKPTRRCSDCGVVKTREEMPLSQRQYACAACGFALPRDRNACRNMVRYSLEGAWWGTDIETGPGTGPETPPEKAIAPTQAE